MGDKIFYSRILTRTARPRSKRLRELGAGGTVNVTGGTATVTGSMGGTSPDWHTHDNMAALDRITTDADGYLLLSTLREDEETDSIAATDEKVKAGYADEADQAVEAENAYLWDGEEFADWLDQPVRRSDEVQFAAVTTDDLHGASAFIPGLTGSGYRLWTDESGVVQLTIDRLTVRQTMLIMELLIERIRSVGGQLVVSAANGKIKSVETIGENYRIAFEQKNTFLAHDLIRCATLSGASPRSYWVEVAGASEEAVLVPVSEFGEAAPVVGDECVLMGNTEVAARQNLILIAATEDGRPRMDVLNGVNSKSFDGCLRARLGNLDGIKDSHFPDIGGDGIYCDNAYLRGSFTLSNGDDVKTRFEIAEGRIDAAVEGFRLTAADGYLANPAFADGMDCWETDNETLLFTVGGQWILSDGNLLGRQGDRAAVCTDAGRIVLRIRNSHILQRQENMRNRLEQAEEVPVYFSFLYRCASAGTLKVWFENVDIPTGEDTASQAFTPLSIEQELAETDGYEQYTCSGLWNGTGDFCLSFTGEIYLYMLVLTTDRAEALSYKYRTLFEQSSNLLRLTAAVFDKDDEALKETGLLIKPEGAGIYAQNSDGKIALIGVTDDELDADGNPTGQSAVRLTADNIRLEGLVTANKAFKILEDGSMEATGGTFSGRIEGAEGYFTGHVRRKLTTIDSTTIGTYTESDSISGDTVLNFDRCGSFIRFDGHFDETIYLYMPGIYPEVTYNNSEYLNSVRSGIGNVLSLYNDSDTSIGITGRIKQQEADEGSVSIVIDPGEFATLICKCTVTAAGEEDVYWEYRKGKTKT